MELRRGDRVRATEAINEVGNGETGEVVARWKSAKVTVRWDKDGLLRRIHRNRLEME